MSKPWSKLQSKLYELIDSKANFQIHCAVYRLNSKDPMTKNPYRLPRYWITIDKKIVFDYPKMFLKEKGMADWSSQSKLFTVAQVYPDDQAVSRISETIREYIDCPKDQILHKEFNDQYGITDILKLVDKRIGKEKFKSMKFSNNFKILLDEKVIDKDTIDHIFKNRWKNED